MSIRTSHIFQARPGFVVVIAWETVLLFYGFSRSELYGAVRAASARAAPPAEVRVSADKPPAASAARPKRSWGPEQVTGKPDTFEAGDFQTA